MNKTVPKKALRTTLEVVAEGILDLVFRMLVEIVF